MSQQEEMSRRQSFRKMLGLAGGVAAAAAAGVGSVQFLQAKEKPVQREVWDGKAKKVANLREVPENTAKAFFFPTNSVQDRRLPIRVPAEFKGLLAQARQEKEELERLVEEALRQLHGETR